jgi:hypothetical protein
MSTARRVLEDGKPMPIEIRELHIRVAINPAPGKEGAARSSAPSEGDGQAGQDAIVAMCVEQVMQILQSKKER